MLSCNTNPCCHNVITVQSQCKQFQNYLKVTDFYKTAISNTTKTAEEHNTCSFSWLVVRMIEVRISGRASLGRLSRRRRSFATAGTDISSISTSYNTQGTTLMATGFLLELSQWLSDLNSVKCVLVV